MYIYYYVYINLYKCIMFTFIIYELHSCVSYCNNMLENDLLLQTFSSVNYLNAVHLKQLNNFQFNFKQIIHF